MRAETDIPMAPPSECIKNPEPSGVGMTGGSHYHVEGSAVEIAENVGITELDLLLQPIEGSIKVRVR